MKNIVFALALIAVAAPMMANVVNPEIDSTVVTSQDPDPVIKEVTTQEAAQ